MIYALFRDKSGVLFSFVQHSNLPVSREEIKHEEQETTGRDVIYFLDFLQRPAIGLHPMVQLPVFKKNGLLPSIFRAITIRKDKAESDGVMILAESILSIFITDQFVKLRW